ncbi:Cell adhesion molecule-related/down-regulated by oncogenes [Larimichthys crocea]|uniref:Uncharacterized protein n=1 Tax=Larimichthys crocea TaxID=215358 RepID=A0ACD3QJT0_LARCR|nr:Cell adhesion molecule-related/down-regulated by oncogenes [Larimichthys crocea]
MRFAANSPDSSQLLPSCTRGLLNGRERACRATRLLAGVKVHHGQWPKGPPVHCAVSQPVSAYQLLIKPSFSGGLLAASEVFPWSRTPCLVWSSTQGSLTISSLKPGHVGVYQCVAHLGHGPAIASRHARVDIAEISEYEDGRRRSLSVQEGSTVLIECPLPHSVPPALPRLRVRGKRIEMSTVQQSQPLMLECTVSGSPAPAAKWFKNGKEVTPASHQRQHNNLAFVAVTRSDEGSYTCAADTEQGTVMSANYTVKVLGKKKTNEDVGSVGTDLTRKETRHPTVTWLFNADPITPSHRFQISGSSLVITEVTPQDEGVFQCLLDNGIGSAQSSGMLSTQSDPQLGSTAGVLLEASPSLHSMQSDEGHERFLTEDEGDTINLPSDRAGDRPTPEAPIIISPPQTHKPDMYDLEWRAGRDGGSPINAYFVKYRKVDEMGTVVGNWHTVRVPGSEKTLRLSELESSSLYEVLMVARSSTGEGQPAMLTFRTGKEKSTTSNKNPSKPPVILVPPKAPEDKTPNTHFGVVIHDRVPEAPDRPTISMATESSVYVTWIPRANGGSPITAFRVEYRRGRSAEWVVAADNISPLKLSVEVRNLEPGSAYKFRVVAMNMYGESPHSIPSKLYQVPQASPRIADRPVVGPHISSTDAISDTQIMLRWTQYSPSSNNNTPIQGFYIYYRPTDSDNDSDYKRDVVGR